VEGSAVGLIMPDSLSVSDRNAILKFAFNDSIFIFVRRASVYPTVKAGILPYMISSRARRSSCSLSPIR
jgi:hypothetical protein